MTKGQNVVVCAALTWWTSKRPSGWKETDHLRSPAINTATEREKSLAHAVAMYIRGENPKREP